MFESNIEKDLENTYSASIHPQIHNQFYYQFSMSPFIDVLFVHKALLLFAKGWVQ